MGIDILPAEFPVESSDFFSKALYPFVKEMVRKNKNKKNKKLYEFGIFILVLG